MAKVQLEKALREDTFEQYMQELREKGHVGLANEGLRVWSDTTVMHLEAVQVSGTESGHGEAG